MYYLYLSFSQVQNVNYVVMSEERKLRAEGDSPKAIYDAESKFCHLQSSIRLESDVLIYPNLRYFGTRSSLRLNVQIF
jgi:hypothetical protein